MTTEISDWYDLDSIRDDLSGDYVLVNDLDEDTDGYSEVSGLEWEPLGGPDDPFTGDFEGQGHAIEGMTVSGDYDAAGLFSVLAGAEITGLVLKDVDVEVEGTAGALAGGGTAAIQAVHVTGSVESTDGTAGGIIGKLTNHQEV